MTTSDQHAANVDAARTLRRLLDPQVGLDPEARKDTAVKAAAVDVSNRNRAAINRAIRCADTFIAALRDLERLDSHGLLYAGLICASQAADDLDEAVEQLEQRLLGVVDAASPAPGEGQ